MANEPIAETLKTAKQIGKFWYHQLPQQTQMELVKLIQQMERNINQGNSKTKRADDGEGNPEQKKKLY